MFVAPLLHCTEPITAPVTCLVGNHDMQEVAMQEYMTEGHEELGMPTSPRKSRRKGRSHGGKTESWAALSSRGDTCPLPFLHMT